MKILLLITSSVCALAALVCLFQAVVRGIYDKEWMGGYALGFLVCLQLAVIGFYLLR